MEIQHVQLDRAKALELYRQYKKHAHYARPIDRECQRAYQLLSKGRLVIRALESIKIAGLKTEGQDAGFPKLALARADAPSCKVSMSRDGSADMYAGDIEPRTRAWRRGGGSIQSRNCFSFPAGSFTEAKDVRWHGEALLPAPPLHLLPKRGLANYHVLWEAEWSRIAPSDPMLLRRIGISDMWVVMAMWELTPVEKAALATRLG